LIANNKLIKQVLQKHTSFIVNAVKSNIYGVNSIILYGGYGRGEGAWVKTADSYDPFNDYDILVVLNDRNKNPTTKQISLVKNNILRKINIQWIDLTFIKLKDFVGNKNKSIFQYDLKHGSKVIYGNSSILNQINNFGSSDIKLMEGKLLFLTRLWPFIGGVDFARDLNHSDALFFRYQMSKAILASIDMILLMKGCYVSSYVDRCKIAIKVSSKNNILNEDMINWALNQKLTPSDEIMNTNEVLELQKKVAQIFAFYSLKLLSKVYSRDFDSVLSFFEFYSKSFKENIKIIGSIVLRKKNDYKRIYVLNKIQILILSALLEETSDENVIHKSNNYLVDIGMSKILDLNELREFIAKERLS
jgi:hypothetical protein